MVQLPPEKLGSFYLGAAYNFENSSITEESINYDAKDLCTHAVCVGMTGSGKTGLCIGLLEEAAMDKVPALIIDPKGDMTNLLLQFENLNPSDFEPWLNADDAARKGLRMPEYAKATAEKWTNGLANWGQSKKRIETLKNTVDYTIYTPGSNAGVPINILGSFAAPNVDFDSDAEMLRERIQGTVAALLGMIKNKADAVRSREGILLATIFEHYWRNGEDLDLAKLITNIQKPPVKQLGVFDVDTFFPEKDRFDLAMEFNTLIASPQFSYWLQGDALDIDKLYFTAEGKPRHSIFYIAHLSDIERMFFVTLLLNSLITWMRKQSGTSSLRSLLYFDEIFGYFPPTAQPPSKKPLLTILKQGRAFGLGAILVTQNPVDIDYKGLSNAGTWFIGKLQTERDKARVLQGLQGAIAEAGNTNQINFDELITALKSRVFLLHNVHSDAPVVYYTRWAMSYLCGPIARPQIKKLMAGKKEKSEILKVEERMAIRQQAVTTPQVQTTSEALPPSIDAAVTQRFFTVWQSAKEAAQKLRSNNLNIIYQPEILMMASLRFYDAKRQVDEVKTYNYIAAAPDEFGRIDWNALVKLNKWEQYVCDEPDYPKNVAVTYSSLKDTLNDAKDFKTIERELANWLYQNGSLVLNEHEKLELYQKAEESVESFKMRVQHAAREERDEALELLEERYDNKLEKIKDRIRKKENSLDEAKAEKQERRTAEVVTIAETIFSIFAKRRTRSFSSAATKRRMRRKAAEKVASVKDDLQALEEDFDAIENELREQLSELNEKYDAIATNIITKTIKPRRTDVTIQQVFLVWHPYWSDGKGFVSAVGEI